MSSLAGCPSAFDPGLDGSLGAAVGRKLKGVASLELPDGRTRKAEVHWYEAHGIGRRMFKIKRFLD